MLDIVRHSLGWPAAEGVGLLLPTTATYRLFLLQPTVVFAARVNQSIFTYPLSTVTFDTVTTGAYTDIKVGMTVHFGSSAGAFNKGSQRIRAAATSTAISIGRSSQGIRPGEVNLSDNDYITVIGLREVWSRPPFISLDGLGTVEKDPGLPVEWRTTTPPPVCNIGSGRVRTIDPVDGKAIFSFPSEGSFSYVTSTGATITTYLWDIADGTILAGDTDEASITLSFPAGFRYVSLTITDSEGHTDSMYVPVVAEDPDDSLMIPFQIISHRITEDGQTMSVRPLEDILVTDYPPGTLAIVWYGEPEDTFDVNNVIFQGWMGNLPAEIESVREATLKDVAIELVDVAGRLNLIHAFSQTVEDNSIRNTTKYPNITWFHIVNLNVDKYVHYLLAWHSTALSLADFYWSDTGTEYATVTLHSDGQSFWDQIRQRVEQMVPLWKLTCDRHNAIRMLPDPLVQEIADRTSTVQASLTEADWTNLRYVNRRHPRIHWLRRGAIRSGPEEVALIAAQIAAGEEVTMTIYFSRAPGDAPGQGESETEANEGLAASQVVLNQATGHEYARINAFQGDFRVTLSGGDDLGIEPAHMTWVELTTPAGRRGQSLTDERMLPIEVNISYSHSREGTSKTVELVLERETSGTPAATYTPPLSDTVPGDDDTWPGDWTAPPPGSVTQPPPVPPLPLYDGQEKVAIIDKYGQIFRTSNFTSGGSSPTWDRKLPTGATPNPSGSQQLHSFVVDPFSPLYRGTGTTVNGWAASQNYIYKISDIHGTTPTWSIVFTFGDDANPALDRFRSIQASFGRFFSEETDNPWLVCVSYYGNRPSFEGVRVVRSTDGGQTWSAEGLIEDAYDPDVGTNRDGGIGLYLSPKTPGLAYTFAYTPGFEPNSAGQVSEDWGQTWTALGVSDLPELEPNDGLGGDLHIPWPDNDNEMIAYFGTQSRGDPMIYNLVRTGSDGSLEANISPNNGTRDFGVSRFSFGVRTFDNDRRYVALAGIGNDVTASEADDKFAAFVSNNYGDTWTEIVSEIAKTDPHPEHIAFAADTEQILYLWGSERYIAYSSDFGATIVDKDGNMSTDFPTDIRDLVGLCGGDAPP